MEISPQLCRAARSLLGWGEAGLARAARLKVATVRRFEAGALVRKASVLAMQQALEAAGLEFIPAGGTSVHGGEGVRLHPVVEPEVAVAQESAEISLVTGASVADVR
jgi:hypothetical protein